jgi:hypothetical protein
VKKPGEFWNLVRKTRGTKTDFSAISANKLRDFFKVKFQAPAVESESVQLASANVTDKLSKLPNVFKDFVISEQKTARAMKKLKTGCAPGADGISAEHLRYALSTTLPFHLSLLLTLCLRTGCVPTLFYTGKLVPILKKPHLDPSLPSSYRPITISVTASKILEILLLEESIDCQMHPAQFGFVPHRSTTSAIALVHDVCNFCATNGTPIHLCSLDAEGAFDAIPHAILLMKAANLIPDPYWRVLLAWYKKMHVSICWNGCTTSPIPVERGTRKGGLSSPLLFNLLYRDMVTELNSADCGVTIQDSNFNVFCYADDLLLASTTTTGLQQLIDIADRYIKGHGLRFNPAKTCCMTFGKHHLASPPRWAIDGCSLSTEDSITYLGAIIQHDKGEAHAQRRIGAAQRAFHGLQGAGLHFGGLEPALCAEVFSVAIRPILLYGCEGVHLKPASLKKMESSQGKLAKSFLGLPNFCHNTPLLTALGLPSVGQSVGLAALKLLRSTILFPSLATRFFLHLGCSSLEALCPNSLVNRQPICFDKRYQCLQIHLQ